MNRNDDQLIIRDIPILPFIVGLVFAGVGVFGFLQGEQPVLLLFAAIGLAFLLFTSVLTITADRITRTLKLEHRSALRHSIRCFSFDEILGIGVERIRSQKGSTYRVVLKRKDGQVIPFRSSSSSGSEKKELQAGRVREIIGVPAFDSSPAGMAYAALSSFIGKVHETDGVRWEIQPVGSGRWHSPDFKIPGHFVCLAQKAEGQASGGFLASVGGMIFKKLLSSHFQPDDTPGLDHAVAMFPLDPALEPHFMAYTDAPDSTRPMLNSAVTTLLGEWAGRYPIRQFQKMSNFGQLTVLFSPSGVYLAPAEFLQPNQVSDLAALGAALVKSQADSRGHLVSPSYAAPHR